MDLDDSRDAATKKSSVARPAGHCPTNIYIPGGHCTPPGFYSLFFVVVQTWYVIHVISFIYFCEDRVDRFPAGDTTTADVSKYPGDLVLLLLLDDNFFDSQTIESIERKHNGDFGRRKLLPLITTSTASLLPLVLVYNYFIKENSPSPVSWLAAFRHLLRRNKPLSANNKSRPFKKKTNKQTIEMFKKEEKKRVEYHWSGRK